LAEPSKGDHAQCPFGGRVVYFDGAVVEVTAKRTPTGDQSYRQFGENWDEHK
jgi:hypothetical protein